MNIQLSHISKSFGGHEVLEDVSFVVSEGERVALLGKNGSGKSTVFKILTGEEAPDSGQVTLNPGDMKIGYLPQVLDDDNPLSSGQKLRKRFRNILALRPDLLLLDEPTNHLDWSGMQWLEQSIKSFAGPVLLISHDRYFLDQVVGKVLELDNGRIKVFGGNYSGYKQHKQIETDALERRYFEQQKRLKKLNVQAKMMKNRTQQLEVATTGADYYVRRKAAKAARSAIAMEGRIQKELSEEGIQKPEPNWELKALFKPRFECSQTVMVLKAVGYKKILKNISWVIERGQRWVLTGSNGSGKTTLIKLMLGQLNQDMGNVEKGNDVRIGYLSQEHQELNSDKSVIEELMNEYVDRTESYKLLRRFLLPQEKIDQPVRLLSSGEKAKLLLAKIMTSGANFIILDEPTNHLDIPSREAFEEALVNYPGTLLVVSHDRYFLERIRATNYFELEKEDSVFRETSERY